jgi:hypothetical protein
VSDISIHITWLDLLLAAPLFGWPGLIIGGVLGALLFPKRRIVCAVLGALIGCAIWFAAGFLMKLL